MTVSLQYLDLDSFLLYLEIEPRLNAVTNHLHANGIEKIYLLGFCW